jgi:nitroreductase
MPDAPAAVSAPRRTAVSNDCIDQIFREGRTHNVWLSRLVPSEVLRRLYELAAFGPTSANTTPARFVFLTTPQAKERLRPALAPLNVDKTMAAPVTVIIAWDTEFYEKLPKLFPHKDMRSMFLGKADMKQLPSEIVRLKVATSFLLPARLASIAVPCPDSTRPRSMPNSFPTASGNRTSSAILAMGITRNFPLEIRACPSMRPAWFCKAVCREIPSPAAAVTVYLVQPARAVSGGVAFTF